MEQDSLQELIAGYALDTLNETEREAAEKLLASNPAARQLLSELEEVTAGLALSVAPVELPGGSLDRLRQKAGVSTGVEVARPRLHTLPPINSPAPTPVARNRPVRLRPRFQLAYAAALVLFLLSGVFGWLWLDTSNRLDEASRSNRDLAAVLAASNLQVTELKGTNNTGAGTMRLYTDPTTNRAYLVAQNLNALPSDKEYEAWLITGDSQARKAGLLGTGGNKDDPLVYALQVNGEVEQYKLVAITIERKGGVDKTDQQPVMVGNISG